jgi:hypothetical protein
LINVKAELEEERKRRFEAEEKLDAVEQKLVMALTRSVSVVCIALFACFDAECLHAERGA